MIITGELSNCLELKGVPPSLEGKLQNYCTYTVFTELNGEQVPTKLTLFEKTKSSIKIPRGCLWAIKDFCEVNKIALKLKYKTFSGDPTNFKINKKLNYTSGPFSYQGRVVSELANFNTCRLSAPTASGKTTISCLYIALSKKGPTLFLVDQERLLNQFIESVTLVLGINKNDIGIIKAKKFNIKPITVGSLQTLGREGFDLNKIKNKFYTVILDECHIAAATTYRNVLLELNSTYLYGVSATPDHPSPPNSDMNRLLEALLGPVSVVVSPQEIPGRLKPKITVKQTLLKFPFMAKKESPEWFKRKCRHKIQKEIAEHPTRNNMISQDILKLVDEGHKVLITVQRVFHGEAIKNLLEDLGLKVSFPYKLKKADDEDEGSTVDHKKLNIDVELLAKDKIDIMIGTLSLFKKGFNAPALSALVYAAPFSGNSTTIIQSVGRILRHYPGKKEAVVIDYQDNSYPNTVLQDWAAAREILLNEVE